MLHNYNLFIDYQQCDGYLYICSETDIQSLSLPFFLSLSSSHLIYFASLFVFVIWRDVNLATPRESILTSGMKKKRRLEEKKIRIT